MIDGCRSITPGTTGWNRGGGRGEGGGENLPSPPADVGRSITSKSSLAERPPRPPQCGAPVQKITSRRGVGVGVGVGGSKPAQLRLKMQHVHDGGSRVVPLRVCSQVQQRQRLLQIQSRKRVRQRGRGAKGWLAGTGGLRREEKVPAHWRTEWSSSTTTTNVMAAFRRFQMFRAAFKQITHSHTHT